MNEIQIIIKHCRRVEEWKFNTCYNESEARCRNCISGGIMLGSFCSKMEEEYNKKFGSEQKQGEKNHVSQ